MLSAPIHLRPRYLPPQALVHHYSRSARLTRYQHDNRRGLSEAESVKENAGPPSADVLRAKPASRGFGSDITDDIIAGEEKVMDNAKNRGL